MWRQVKFGSEDHSILYSIPLTLVLPRWWGVTPTPSGFPPGCAKTAKDFTKRFYVIVSSSFAVILTYKSRRYHLHQGQGVPSKVEGRGRSLRPSLYFSMGNAQKCAFSCFSEQILAKCVLYVIYLDERHA